MLNSSGAANRVSWVLRREVCPWFYLATCTPNRNEGNTISGQTAVIPRRHNRRQTSHTSRSRQQGQLCQPRRRRLTGWITPWPRLLPAQDHLTTTPSPPPPKSQIPLTSPTQQLMSRWSSGNFLFILEDIIPS